MKDKWRMLHEVPFSQICLQIWRCCKKDEMQGAEGECAGSVLTYVTKPESR